MARPVIIHLRSAEFFGGPERAILGQCRALDDYESVCASFVRGDGPNRFLDEASVLGLKTARIRDAFAGDFRAVGQIVGLIKKFGAKILICHDYKANFYGRRAAKKCKIAQVAHFRGYTTEDRKVRLYNYINAVLLRKMSLVIAVSERSSRILQEQGVSAEKIRVVFNAIENDKLIDPGFRRSIDSGRPLKAVSAGRLSFEKGYDVLLEAIENIKDEAPQFIIDIYGHGPEEKKLKNLVSTWGLQDIVAFKGFVDNILPVLRKSDFLILPSRSEGMPNILLEAWSQKLGALSTSVGGVPDMMEDGQIGLLAPPEDADILGQKLLFALTHPKELIEFGEKGYSKVREKYSYLRQAELLREIYGEILYSNGRINI